MGRGLAADKEHARVGATTRGAHRPPCLGGLAGDLLSVGARRGGEPSVDLHLNGSTRSAVVVMHG
jgi:hypothetical protein